MAGLASLTDKLSEMKSYLEAASSGKIQPNQEIIANMQSILNLLPNLNVEELVKAMLIKTNDLHMVIYLSSLIRSVIALHDLVNNQIRYNEQVEIHFDGSGGEKKKLASEKKNDQTEKKEGTSSEEKKEDSSDKK